MRHIQAFALLAALLSSGAASAHTDNPHATQPAFDYSKAEETAFGVAADPKAAKRAIAVRMADTMRFTPASITVKRGEAVRFVVKNEGKLMHEMVLGTRADLEAHAAMMRMHPGMEHEEPNMLHVAPGRTGEMGWRFTKAGEFFYGCLVPGHFEAGMVGRIVVTDGHSPAHALAAKPEAPLVSGEVRRIDKDAGKITLKHEAIPNLAMTPMTMVFNVQDRAMLAALKPGDKVRFRAQDVKGALTVTWIAPPK